VIKIRILRPGRPPVVFDTAADVVLCGRSNDCDVVIDEKFVSSRHALIVAGRVVVDLDSSNGTYVDGVRVERAAVFEGGTIFLGHRDVTLEVERVTDPGSESSRIDLLRRELETLRRTNRELLDELDELRMREAHRGVQRASRIRPGSGLSAPDDDDPERRLRRLERENVRLRDRIVELEERAGTESRP